jgi:hypothetical protein
MVWNLAKIGTHLAFIQYYKIASGAEVEVDWDTSDVKYFNGGADLDAGDYRVYYEQGALGIVCGSPSNPYNDKYMIHATSFTGGGSRGIGCYIEHSSGTGDVLAPGAANGVYDTQADCEAANVGQYVNITHTGGKIGVWFYDYNWPDNFGGSPNPTFSLYKKGVKHLVKIGS